MRLRFLLLRFYNKYWLKKIVNAIKYYLSRKKTYLKLKYQPLIMDIEPTTGCNFRCTMCQVSDPNFKAINLNIDTFKKVIDENKQLIKIKLQGMGEPFVNKHIFEMIKYANINGITVEFVTNGSLLNEEVINHIIKQDICRINISIDGATKKTFESIRVKSNFDDVIKNATNLSNHIKSNRFKTEFVALCLVQKKNYFEIEEIIDLCKKIGFQKLYFQVQLTGWGKKEWEEINKEQDINFSNEDIRNKFFDLKIQKSTKDFKVDIIEENLLNFKNKCSYPFENPYITSTGKVLPCCMIADERIVNFGSVAQNNFSEIWNSDNYQNFRENINNNNLKSYCKNCYKEFN